MKNRLCVKKHNEKTWIEETKDNQDDMVIPDIVQDIHKQLKATSKEFSKIVDTHDTALFPNGIIDYKNARDALHKLIDKKNIIIIIEKTVARHPKIQLPNAIEEEMPPIEEIEEEVIPPIEEDDEEEQEVIPLIE